MVIWRIKMKLFFLFVAIDLLILIMYPIAYITYLVRKVIGAKH